MMVCNEKNIKTFRGQVCRGDREYKNSHKAAVFWLIGLSGSGKSTIAHEVEKILHDEGKQVFVFDGDNVRHGLCADLSFSPEGRAENLRRIAEICKLFVDCGVICLCAFISPLKSDRDRVHAILENDYHDIYINCSVDECERRDVKGYYKLAREGKIKNYTGVSAPFEPPASPVLELDTVHMSVENSAGELHSYITSIISS